MDDPREFSFLKNQFKKKNFWLYYEEPRLLGTAQCGKYQKAYIVYRCIWCLFFLATVIALTITAPPIFWLTRLTRWCLLAVFVSTCLQLACAVYAFKWQKEKPFEKEPILYTLNWMAYNFSGAGSFLVTLTYWLLLYDGATLTFADFAGHGLNTVYVLIDIFITGIPIRLLHFYLTTIPGLIYIAFNIIHGFISEIPIYPILDWKNAPSVAIMYSSVLLIVGVPIMQAILFVLFWFRVLLYATVFKGKTHGKGNPDIKVINVDEGVYTFKHSKEVTLS